MVKPTLPVPGHYSHLDLKRYSPIMAGISYTSAFSHSTSSGFRKLFYVGAPSTFRFSNLGKVSRRGAISVFACAAVSYTI